MLTFHHFSIIAAFFLSVNAYAGVSIGGSRVIFPAEKKEQTISVQNPDATPYLIQSWVEDAAGKIDNTHFILTPPLFRLDAEGNNLLRIVKLSDEFDKNKESLYWLNIKSIPAKGKGDSNTLQIAVRTRLKLIVRPKALQDHVPEYVTNQLQWTKTAKGLQVYNPTPYFMNFISVKVGGHDVPDANYLAPLSSASYALDFESVSGDVSWKILNDYGGAGPEHRTKI